MAACVVAAIALGAPAAASGQGAVDEYTLDLPEGGDAGPVDANNPPPPTTGATSSATGGGSGTEAEPGTAAGTGTGAGAQDPKAGGPKGKPQPAISFAPFHDGVQPQSLDTTSRSAPEIVADALLDGAMLPILAALALITAAGAWRVLRSRRTLTGQAG